MLFHSSIRKELARSFGATLVVLATIVMTMMLVRTLGLASRGTVDPSEVLMVLGYTMLSYLPMILTLSLFISIVGSLSRMYSDSEMVIWFSCGRGLGAFLGPLFRFSWPILLMIALVALVIWPWSNQQSRDLRDRYQNRGDLDRVAPGQFQESARGNRVFFIDKETSNDKTGGNVFIATSEHDRQSVTSARKGRIEVIGNDRYLLLNNGQQFDSSRVNPNLRISEFEEYGIVIGEVAPSAQEVPARAKPTLTLILEPTPLNLGELAWRIGLALAAGNFVVIAAALSSINPRGGRSNNLLLALFSFVLYYNLINLGQNWIGTGRISFFGLLFALHASMAAASFFWLGKRHNNWTLSGLLGRFARRDRIT